MAIFLLHTVNGAQSVKGMREWVLHSVHEPHWSRESENECCIPYMSPIGRGNARMSAAYRTLAHRSRECENECCIPYIARAPSVEKMRKSCWLVEEKWVVLAVISFHSHDLHINQHKVSLRNGIVNVIELKTGVTHPYSEYTSCCYVTHPYSECCYVPHTYCLICILFLFIV